MEEQIQNIVTPESSSVQHLSVETFVLIRDFIYSKTGIFYPDKKHYFVEGRLLKRLQILGLATFEDYFHLIKYSNQKDIEFEILCNTITINETSFFRNAAQMSAFQERFAIEIIRAKSKLGLRTFRIWSAACSSGEEPYTIAMVYLEHLQQLYPDIHVEIVGTDINTAVLEMARNGEYTSYAVRNIPELYLKKYFEISNGIYKVKKEVKDLVKFEYINLVDRNRMRSMKHFDCIFCANVLIYFDEKVKIQVVGDLYDSLNRGGYLFIGFSELLHRISTAFKLVSIPKTTAYKKE